MMKRAGAIVLVAAISLSLFAGGASSGARPLRVAYVTDLIVAPSPHTLRGSALLGFDRAVKKFHLQGRVVQYQPAQGETPTLASLVRQKYDLIFTSTFPTTGDYFGFASVAAKSPATKFVSPSINVQFLPGKPGNVQGWDERVEQPAFLAGYLAALMEKRRPGKDVIGSVGGLRVGNVVIFIAGYEAGARKADPGITTLNGYSGDFGDPAKCRAVALGQVARGAGVLFDVAGLCGPGTLQVAKEKGVWGIGVDTDQSYRGGFILTSVIKRPDLEFYRTLEDFVHGRLKTGVDKVWTMQNGGVDLGRVNPKVPHSFVARVQRIRAQIVAGKIAVPSTLSR